MSNNSTRTQDRRRTARWQASYFFKTDKQYSRPYFDVIDVKTGESIGHLVDLTFDGMKIESTAEIGRGRPFSLRIELPEEIEECGEIHIAARSLWADRLEGQEKWYVGFEILSIAPPYGDIVDALIQQ